jgi:pantoate--beta-alanine ligase
VQVVRLPRELQQCADAERAAGRRIALVPTMGALHAGHLSLVAEARKRADRVWLSVFVNPTQFDQAQDFAGYPRELEQDLEQCRSHGVDLVYAPAVEDAYPEGSQTWVDVSELSQPLCGRSRVGHFRGVTTIVCKLLLAAKPHAVLFGEKDFQQLAVLRRMVRDLGFDVDVVGCPTVREPDGLALSSRNQRLGPKARAQATVLVGALDEAQAAVAAGERSPSRLLERVRAHIAAAPQARVDYAELCSPDSLEPVPEPLAGPALLALAVHFSPDPDGQGSDVRLIDSRLLPAAC